MIAVLKQPIIRDRRGPAVHPGPPVTVVTDPALDQFLDGTERADPAKGGEVGRAGGVVGRPRGEDRDGPADAAPPAAGAFAAAAGAEHAGEVGRTDGGGDVPRRGGGGDGGGVGIAKGGRGAVG